MEHLTYNEIEEIVFKRNELQSSTLERMLNHIEVCGICRSIAEREQQIYAEFRKYMKAELRPPYKLLMKRKNYINRKRPDKIYLAADTNVMPSAGFSNIGSFISSEYGILIRFVSDPDSKTITVSALSAQEEILLDNLLVRFVGQDNYFQLDSNAKAVLPIDSFKVPDISSNPEIEVLFPMIKFELPLADFVHKNEDIQLKVDYNGKGTIIHWKKNMPYLPDVKRLYAVSEDDEIVHSEVESDIIRCDVKIRRAALYPA